MLRLNIHWLLLVWLMLASTTVNARAPLGGFVPFVGIGMTDEHKTLDDLDLGSIPFIADPSFSLGAPLLGSIGSPHFEMALLDTGAATHIITQDAFNGFDIEGNGLRGTNLQTIGGATGQIELEINDAAGFYTAGLGDRTSAGSSLELDTNALRGQTSIATLTAPNEWSLPNILGLPMAAQHALAIRNSEPQIFQFGDRTVRTPQVELMDLGTGDQQGILRRAPLQLRPGIGFIQGPQFVFNLELGDVFSGEEISVHNNPASPSVVQDSSGNGGGLFIDVDMTRGLNSLQDKELLFDTGADLTVVSEITAARLGFDPILDTPDFVLEVEGSGGVSDGVPGFYLDQLNIDTVGGSFALQDVPIAVLDVTNPNDPGNVIDGILGMHLFTGRDLVIDANASIGQGGVGPSLYISDPVTQTHTWTSTASSANWNSPGSWSASGIPGQMGVAQISNVTGSNQTAVVDTDSTVFQLTVSSSSEGAMSVSIQNGAKFTTFGETLIETGGVVELSGGGSLDTQFVNIEGGTLRGTGEIFAGSGPINGVVRNLSGRVEPGNGGSATGKLAIVGDYSSLVDATLAIDLGGTVSESLYDVVDVDRFAFLAGTLEVSLAGGFEPSIGDTFSILTAGEGVESTFDQLMLPDGFQWSVDYQPQSVELAVTGIGGNVPGDFDSDGDVDAADLAAWEVGFGQLDGFTGGDFLTWQRSYQGSGLTSNSAAVPEPTSAVLSVIALLAILTRRRAIVS